jgi:hypothetical protein
MPLTLEHTKRTIKKIAENKKKHLYTNLFSLLKKIKHQKSNY